MHDSQISEEEQVKQGLHINYNPGHSKNNLLSDKKFCIDV